MPKKSPPAPRAGTTAKQSTGDPRFSAAFDRWKAGTSLAVLVKDLGCTRSALRRQLTQLAGGKDAFKAERATGAGGKAEPFAGKRATSRGVTKNTGDAVVAYRDEGVPFVVDTSRASGWSWRVEYRTKLVHVKDVGQVAWREVAARVYVDPDGVEYVEASSSERADLIRLAPMPSMPNFRMRRLETSSVARKLQREETEVARGEEALKRTRERKRAAREARKTT